MTGRELLMSQESFTLPAASYELYGKVYKPLGKRIFNVFASAIHIKHDSCLIVFDDSSHTIIGLDSEIEVIEQP